jgi:gamma-butyrobetaine dioxygenase
VDAPILCLNTDGEVVGVRWNERMAGPFELPEELVEPYYRAYQLFQVMLRNTDFSIELPLRDGDLLAFDNHRILHGRKAFDAAGHRRHIHGCLVTRDSFHSRLRTLQRKVRMEVDRRKLSSGASP